MNMTIVGGMKIAKRAKHVLVIFARNRIGNPAKKKRKTMLGFQNRREDRKTDIPHASFVPG